MSDEDNLDREVQNSHDDQAEQTKQVAHFVTCIR